MWGNKTVNEKLQHLARCASTAPDEKALHPIVNIRSGSDIISPKSTNKKGPISISDGVKSNNTLNQINLTIKQDEERFITKKTLQAMRVFAKPDLTSQAVGVCSANVPVQVTLKDSAQRKGWL